MLCDGCGFGERPKEAAIRLADNFTSYMQLRLDQVGSLDMMRLDIPLGSLIDMA